VVSQDARRRAPLRSILVAALLLAAPRAALAQTSAAEALFDQGRTALAANDLETACARFRASDQIEPAAGTRANLADCEEQRGKVATAWATYKSALSKLAPGDSRAAILQERIAKLEARLPKLVLTLAPGSPKGTTVAEGDATIGMGATYGVPLPLDPGVHHLAVGAPGRTSRTLNVTLAEGKTTSIAVEPGGLAGGPPAPPPPNANPPVAEPAAMPGIESRSPGPWIVGGVGVAGLIVGAVTGGLVLSNKSTANANCTNGPPPTCRTQAGIDAANAVHTLGPVTTVALVVGGAGLAGAAIWLGVRGSGKQPEVKVGVAPIGAGAAWRLEASW
jgi:hypothetical protein